MFYENSYFGNFVVEVHNRLGISQTIIVIILSVILLWTMVWKLLGLWKSARKGSVIWFIIIGLTNTIGIIPILYIFVFSKIKLKKFKRRKK